VTDRIVETEYDRKQLLRYLEKQAAPFTVSITPGKHRTTHQNRLQRRWMQEIGEQSGMTAEEARAFCKLHFAIPILRRENEAFRARYDAIVKPLTYEQKLALMAEPLDMPATRIMTTKQKHEYLDTIFRHFSGEGLVLTNPEDLRRVA
jgi:formyltetrahydrofolate hydrolase